jgi:hypothetical protein
VLFRSIKAGLLIALIISALLAVMSLAALIGIIIAIITGKVSLLQLHLLLLVAIGFLPVFIGFSILLDKRKTFKALPYLSVTGIALCVAEKAISGHFSHNPFNGLLSQLLFNTLTDPTNYWLLICIYYLIVLVWFAKDVSRAASEQLL